MPVIRDSNALPPRPHALASLAINARRCFSFSKGSITDNFFLSNTTLASTSAAYSPLSNRTSYCFTGPNYKNGGQEWRKSGKPVDVQVHDFPDPKVGKAVPYGVYDIYDNKGWVNVGTSADTAEFAVQSIRYWWRRMGKARYPKTKKLLICADSGGSNGYRSHLWKLELQKLADQEQLQIGVCHFPPGTSKWNKIEHKLFSFITMNWRGKPLINYRTIVKLIAATTSTTGLTVKVRLDNRQYQKGLKVSAEILDQLNIQKHDFHGEWNYTIMPR